MRFPDDVPTLTDGLVTLRAHGVDDIPALLEQAIDPVMVEWTNVPVPSSTETASDFATKIIPAGWADGGSWAFAVEAADDDGTARFCGTVELRPEGDRRAEIAYGAHPWARGRGFVERACRLLLDWGFREQRLDTVIWWAPRGNWPSRRLAWRLGFSFDGTVRQWLPQRGSLRDAWVGALLASDKREPRTPWYDVPRIVGRAVTLRAPGADDVPRIVQACQDERTAYWLTEMPRPYTADDARDYVARRQEQRALGHGITWAVAEPASDAMTGSISLFDVTPGREAEIGYWTHPDARGHGVMTEAVGLVVRHAFLPREDGGMGLRRVYLFTGETNTASQHVAEANGFVRTGRDRHGTLLRDDTMLDTICYDLLVDEYDVRTRA